MKFFYKFKFLILLAMSFSFVACGNSMKEDAESAAELTLESLDYIIDRNLEKSEKAYLESKQIQKKYTENSEAFYELYMTFLEQKTDK